MKARTPEQLKGQIRSFAQSRNLQAQEVLQKYLLESVLGTIEEMATKFSF